MEVLYSTICSEILRYPTPVGVACPCAALNQKYLKKNSTKEKEKAKETKHGSEMHYYI